MKLYPSISRALADDYKIEFDSLEECIEFKNALISFIKRIKRERKDKALDPELTFYFKKLDNDE